MKTLYLWVSDKGWTPFQYNELSELSSEFEARNIKLGDRCKLGDGCELGTGANWATSAMFRNRYLSAHLVIQYPIGVRMLFK